MPSSFKTCLRYENTGRKVRGRELYVLLNSFEYHVGKLGSGFKISVPVGFETDLASIPFWARWIFKPDGKYAKAAVIHDWLYVTHMYDRDFSDYVFYHGMKVLGVDIFTRLSLWTAVRIFGIRGWEKDSERRERIKVEKWHS